MQEKPQLAYWKIRGLAQPIRHMFAYLKQEYVPINYEEGEPP
jgi:hypothetical protein